MRVAPVRSFGRVPLHHHARSNGICCFVVLNVGARVADVGEGESHDLPRIGGIGHDFLVAGHRRVEAKFRDSRSRCAKSVAVKHRTISKCYTSGWFQVEIWCSQCLSRCGHVAVPQGLNALKREINLRETMFLQA